MGLFPLTNTGRAGALQAAREAGCTLRLLSARIALMPPTLGKGG